MIRPVFMITSIYRFSGCVDTGKLRAQIDKILTTLILLVNNELEEIKKPLTGH